MTARRGRRWLPAFASALLTVTLVQAVPASAADTRPPAVTDDSRAITEDTVGAESRTPPDSGAGTDPVGTVPDKGAWWLDDSTASLTSLAAELEDGGAADITDGLPVDSVGAEVDVTDAATTVLLPDSGVARQVQREASDGDRVPVIIRLREQVDMSVLGERAAAAGLAAALDKRADLRGRGLTQAAENRRVAEAGEDARGAAVVETLRSFADERRAPVADTLAQLRVNGHATKVQPYWVFSGFSASVDRQALTRLERHPDVASVTLDATIQAPEIDPADASRLPTWGLEAVNAPDVWSDYDDRGDGVVVGIMDSGVDGNHPALAHSWRGNVDDPA